LVLERRIRSRVLGLLVAVATSCTPADVADTPSDSGPPAIEVPVQPNGVPRILELGSGEHGIYRIEALDPPTHTFEVRLVVEPAAELRLWFHTPYGVRLDLVRSSTTDQGCASRGGRIVCVQEFPALEAQHAGRWTLHARNASQKAASAEITVTFSPLG
jgi:hypothetical protein